MLKKEVRVPTISLFSAILELNEPVEFRNAIKPICMPEWTSRQFETNDQGTIAGWGWDGKEWAENLKEVDTNILSLHDCQDFMKQWWEDKEWHTVTE